MGKFTGVDDGSAIAGSRGGNWASAAFLTALLFILLGTFGLFGIARIRAQQQVASVEATPIPVEDQEPRAQREGPRPLPKVVVERPAGSVGVATRIHSASGDLEVRYVVQAPSPTMPTDSGKLTGVTSIEFQPGYVAVLQAQGAGRVFFNGSTTSLEWNETK